MFQQLSSVFENTKNLSGRIVFDILTTPKVELDLLHELLPTIFLMNLRGDWYSCGLPLIFCLLGFHSCTTVGAYHSIPKMSFSDAPVMGGGNGIIGGKHPGSFSLPRQPSIYSLTIDEFQSTFTGLGKDFGSMNMDELVKNIWTYEESQAMVSAAGGGEVNVPSGNLQRQGSLALPRTLSQKTVDEVWRDLIKDSGGNDLNGICAPDLQQREQTLGEMTLEEFLVRAGVVREGPQLLGRENGAEFYSDLSRLGNNTSLALGFQQTDNTGPACINSNGVSSQPLGIVVNEVGIRSSQQQLQQKPQPQPQPQLPPIFPKKSVLSFSSPMNMTCPGAKRAIIGIDNPSMNIHGGGLQGGGMDMIGLENGTVTVATESPAKSDVLGKSSLDTSSLSPNPYGYNQGVPGKKCCGALEKVVERRHRRMIKNRESAARSRARKQAYTLELEQEVAKLKELNQELQKKQEEIIEMQKTQILENIKERCGGKTRCLRRTLTGPW